LPYTRKSIFIYIAVARRASLEYRKDDTARDTFCYCAIREFTHLYIVIRECTVFSVSMKFVLQPLMIHITNCDAKSRMMEGSAEKRKYGEMLSSTIRAIICGLFNCGKTNFLISLLESPSCVCFENVHIYSKSLQQPKYRYLENLFMSINEIGFFMFSNNEVFHRARRAQILFLSLMT